MAQTPLAQLNEKLKALEKLQKVIDLHGGQTLLHSQREEIDRWKEKLEFRLNELVLECKLREADIRIGVFQEITKILSPKK